ncbi:GNAT family N-acetyltransferase [Pseudoalteromonas sp. T1lg23B]|uniref:GNAT family N-acetyltransferase n=1 Tax=Pseudoalteromonas sp. T1lg23B TaxID=2077097 RepID=UPI000CF73E21|nr:GNAT family N-acetyltransferase [Pseudoalteromonas sp. T1lg23B]
MTIINTQRLMIRRAVLDDANFILQLLNQRSFIDNIADKQVNTIESANKYIQNAFFEPYKVSEKAPYIVTLTDGTPIGIVGFYQRPVFNVPDLGYAFLDSYTGQGYAREAAIALLEFARDKIGLTSVLLLRRQIMHPVQNCYKHVGLVTNKR